MSESITLMEFTVKVTAPTSFSDADAERAIAGIEDEWPEIELSRLMASLIGKQIIKGIPGAIELDVTVDRD